MPAVGLIVAQQSFDPQKLTRRRPPKAMHPAPLDAQLVTGLAHCSPQAVLPRPQIALVQIYKPPRQIQLEQRLLARNPNPSRLATFAQQLHFAFSQEHLVRAQVKDLVNPCPAGQDKAQAPASTPPLAVSASPPHLRQQPFLVCWRRWCLAWSPSFAECSHQRNAKSHKRRGQRSCWPLLLITHPLV